MKRSYSYMTSGIVLLAFLAIGVWVFGTGREQAPLAQNNSGTTDLASLVDVSSLEPSNLSGESRLFHGSVNELLGKGEELECRFSKIEDNTTVAGVIYIDDERMRGDFEIRDEAVDSSEPATIQSHVIRDGNWSHIWSSFQPTKGTKVRIESDVKDAQSNEGNLTYRCTAWTPDESKFALPLDVTFTDLTEEARSFRKQLENLENISCSDCATLQSSESKNQCIEILGCTP